MNGKHNMLNVKVGIKIKLERTKRNYSQEKLAELANITKNSLGAIERGTSVPSINTLDSIAQALEMPLIELIDVSKVDL